MIAPRLLVAILAFRLLSPGQTATAPTETVPYYIKDVYLAEAEFTEGRITGLCRDVLKDLHPGLGDVWFFTSEAAVTDYRNGKLSDHISYDTWRRSYDHLKDLRPVARMISISDSSILLFRGADGAVTRRVLSGKNPLDVTVDGGKEVHLLDLAPTLRNYQSSEYRINVFAWTPEALTEDLGLRVIADLKPKLPFPEISLFVRNDPWFIDDTVFPAFPPFVPEFAPPAKAQYIVSPTLVCGTPVVVERYGCSIFHRHD
jgi:hypothetical protein